MILEISRQIFENKAHVPNFTNIRPVGAEVFRADRRTEQADMKKLIIAFLNFAYQPKKRKFLICFNFQLALTKLCTLHAYSGTKLTAIMTYQI